MNHNRLPDGDIPPVAERKPPRRSERLFYGAGLGRKPAIGNRDVFMRGVWLVFWI